MLNNIRSSKMQMRNFYDACELWKSTNWVKLYKFEALDITKEEQLEQLGLDCPEALEEFHNITNHYGHHLKGVKGCSTTRPGRGDPEAVPQSFKRAVNDIVQMVATSKQIKDNRSQRQSRTKKVGSLVSVLSRLCSAMLMMFAVFTLLFRLFVTPQLATKGVWEGNYGKTSIVIHCDEMPHLYECVQALTDHMLGQFLIILVCFEIICVACLLDV